MPLELNDGFSLSWLSDITRTKYLDSFVPNFLHNSVMQLAQNRFIVNQIALVPDEEEKAALLVVRLSSSLGPGLRLIPRHSLAAVQGARHHENDALPALGLTHAEEPDQGVRHPVDQ